MAFSPEERARLLKRPVQACSPQELIAPAYAEVSDLDETTRMQYVDLFFWLVGDILLKTDKMSMAHSLESRVPFLDKEVFNVSRTIPTPFKANGEQTKIALREAAERAIPKDWAQKEKLGFPVPMVDWLRQDRYYNQVKEWFTETALPRRLLFGRSHGLRLRLRLWSRLLLRLRRGGFFRLRRLNLRGRLGNGRRIDGFGIDGQRSGRRIDARYGLGRLDEVAFVGIVLRHEIALCLHAGRLEIGFAGFFHENLRLDRRSLDDRRTPSPSISPLFDGGLGKPACTASD